MTPRRDTYIAPESRFGLCKAEAAAYIGVSAPTFDGLIRAGQMPPAKRIGSRLLWSRRAVEAAFESLPDDAVAGVMTAEQAEWA